jgi:hypothetical protein
MPRDPLGFDPEQVLANVRRADTEDLLDRVTAYRHGMEPEAVEIIERELRDRGVTDEQMADHAGRVEREVLFLPDGIAARCSQCNAPAVAQAWGWFRLLRKIPIFPRRIYLCRTHARSS